MRKILLVEDEEMLRDAYTAILSTGPYTIGTAGNGQEALVKCRTDHFDLILLDLMMPVMDGVAFLESCTPELLKGAKVVLLSNLSSGAELSKAMSLGAYKSVVKAELSPKELLSLVRLEVGAA